MKTPEGISIIPTTYQEIVSLLTSDELAGVEGVVTEWNVTDGGEWRAAVQHGVSD